VFFAFVFGGLALAVVATRRVRQRSDKCMTQHGTVGDGRGLTSGRYLGASRPKTAAPTPHEDG
jgi:hypothetical protein